MNPEAAATLRRRIEEMACRYPNREAALLPALHIIQQEAGCISVEEERFVAEILGVRPMRVREVVTFYTMFTRRPLGKYHIQVCSNLSCALLGGLTILEYLKRKLEIEPGATTSDGKFTLTTVECLGACEQAPCLMVNYDYYGNLDKNRIDEILSALQ